MANTSDNTTTFTCSACMDDFSLDVESSYNISGNDYCFRCLKSRMDMMTTSSDGFPCEISGATLDPGMFPPALFGGEDACEKYKNIFNMKQMEWATLIEHRLYCDCPEGMYIGALTGNQITYETTFGGCGSCGQVYCMKCAGKTDESDASIISHLRCSSAEMARRAEETMRELEGLTRGVDYQMCPECRNRVQRSIGCNHMTCSSCFAHFCYICGCEAGGNSGHWSIIVGDVEKCLFVGEDVDGAARGEAKRAMAKIL
jgi:hypothetical protein